MSDPLIGKRLGSFEIAEAIGQGGMATVYKALQPAMNRTVALKVLSTPMAGNATFLARFKQEAQLIASLEHAHILPVYDMGEQEGWVFIAMRYLSRGTLTARLAQGPIPIKDIGKWVEQIGSALDYAHQRGIVHRDVKPSNVLLDAQGNAFLADFGIAKWYEGSLDLTGSGVIGTPQYMSPEQGQGLKLDGRSDEYSLAIMAYEMIIGRPPFQAETPLAIVLKHITEPLTPPSSLNPHVPQAVSDVISKALSKNPADRYPSAGAFAQALSAVIASEPIGGTLPLPNSYAPTESIHVTRQQPSRRTRQFQPRWWMAAMLIAIVGGIGGVLLLSANQPPPDRPAASIGVGANVIIQTPSPGITPSSSPVVTDTSTVDADRCTPPLFAETFDNPDSGLPHGEQNDTRWGYADGAYQLLISAANKMQTRLLGSPLQDYDATIEAHFASENLGSYGLVAAARGPSDYYALVVDGDQRYAITRRTSEGSRAIQDWTYTSALNEAQSPNQLRAVQLGSELAFFANGVLLKVVQLEDDVPALRSIGLTASSFGTGTDARFDNLKVCAPSENLASRQIELIDSFEDNHNGWAPQQYTAKGGSTIENGQFVIETHYVTDTYAVLNWNPNLAFDAVNLRVDTHIISGTRSSRVGVVFGVQDLDNYYLFDVSDSGRYHLYRRQDGEMPLIADGASPLIRANLARNQIRLSVISNTLSVAINDRVVIQAVIDYTPGYVGFYCGVYQPDQTLCAFDNLQVTGSPSLGQALLYPFCNCRRTLISGQPLEVRWQWAAGSIEYLDQFKAATTLSVTLDGVPVENPQRYWTPARVRQGEAEMFWSQVLPPLDPGSHLVEFVVSTDKRLTDGLDENGDGQLDTFGPGNILAGYVEAVIMP